MRQNQMEGLEKAKEEYNIDVQAHSRAKRNNPSSFTLGTETAKFVAKLKELEANLEIVKCQVKEVGRLYAMEVWPPEGSTASNLTICFTWKKNALLLVMLIAAAATYICGAILKL